MTTHAKGSGMTGEARYRKALTALRAAPEKLLVYYDRRQHGRSLKVYYTRFFRNAAGVRALHARLARLADRTSPGSRGGVRYYFEFE